MIIKTYNNDHEINITVEEDKLNKYLKFDGTIQTEINKNTGLSNNLYIKSIHIPFNITKINKVLILGLGGGALNKQIITDYPNTKLITVEYYQNVIDACNKYFLPSNENNLYIQGDGFDYIKNTNEIFDIIFVDAYRTDYFKRGNTRFSQLSIPDNITSNNFFQNIKNIMNDNSIVIININIRYRNDLQLIKQMTNIFINNPKMSLPIKQNNIINNNLLFIFGNSYNTNSIIDKMISNDKIKQFLKDINL